MSQRIDHSIIQAWVKPNTKLLDLGCGDGSLLQLLASAKQVQGYGLEIGADEINACISKGVNVIEHNLDAGLPHFADNSFDLVIMTQALQTMRFPHLVLDEMLRVGRECIIAFPNFGHWKARWHLSLSGRMPVSDLLPFEWYDTPNIHFCTVKDFEVLCAEKGIKILQRQVVGAEKISSLANALPNLFAVNAVYHLSK
ncbi:methionine biosynthesis protein MetW [Simiduia curdlanivorans]|uniref:Methionine biosynthesis protein MetW n=1 Tax=Simiduia curdlanivorans TaxID=1492769 RepID=A0ABV8V3C5_9GAMM|nr:methionine biosynthesis protein MetW [Simiduia curdlanivorans]MDN3637744.1 methionine biosynthesis protein MetW [Simiduia curdlanivorans]